MSQVEELDVDDGLKVISDTELSDGDGLDNFLTTTFEEVNKRLVVPNVELNTITYILKNRCYLVSEGLVFLVKILILRGHKSVE